VEKISLPLAPAIRQPTRRSARAQANQEMDRKIGEVMLFRAKVVKARLQLHGITDISLLAWQLLTYSLMSWLGKPGEKQHIDQAVAFAGRMARATLANISIRRAIAAGHLTGAGVRNNPSICLVFDQATCIAGLGTAIHATRNKSWGPLLGIKPLPSDLDFDPLRVAYQYHANSRYNRRFEQRQYLKRILGPEYKSLVTLAMGSSKNDFLRHLEVEWWEQGVTQMRNARSRYRKHTLRSCGRKGAAGVIKARLGLDPARFWRVVRGKDFIELPEAYFHRDLFTGM